MSFLSVTSRPSSVRIGDHAEMGLCWLEIMAQGEGRISILLDAAQADKLQNELRHKLQEWDCFARSMDESDQPDEVSK